MYLVALRLLNLVNMIGCENENFSQENKSLVDNCGREFIPWRCGNHSGHRDEGIDFVLERWSIACQRWVHGDCRKISIRARR